MSKFADSLENEFYETQRKLAEGISLVNRFSAHEINLISGVDLAYWNSDGKDYAVCCIVTLSYKTKKVIEMKHLCGEITIPYIPLLYDTYPGNRSDAKQFTEMLNKLKTRYQRITNKKADMILDGTQ